MKFNATAKIAVFLWALLFGCYSYAVHYDVQVYQRMMVYSEGQPQHMMPLAQGGMELSSHTMNFKNHSSVTGELATITLAPMSALAPEPEPDCIVVGDVLFLRPKGNGRCESNIHVLSKVRPMPFEVQATQQEKKDSADGSKEVFKSVLNPEIMMQLGFKRSVFTSKPLPDLTGQYLHAIQELRGAQASADGELTPRGEFVNLRFSRDRRISLQQLVRELINSGNLETVEPDSQLSDDLFHVIYGSDIDICLIKSPEGKRRLKIVVQDPGVGGWPFVIIITGEPENQMASSGEDMGFSFASTFLDEFMYAHFCSGGASLKGQEFQLMNRVTEKGGARGKFDTEY